MWKYKNNCKVFENGKEDYITASKIAVVCKWFNPDVDEEWVCDDKFSCYNCRYRRWTPDSFQCMKED